MTDLQMSLIVIGGLIVIGVVVYNKWQEHKVKRSVERAFSLSHDDLLMGAGSLPVDKRQEPYLSQAYLDAVQQEGAAKDMPADVYAYAPLKEPAAVENLQLAEERELPVDYLIDCTVPLPLNAQLRGEKLLASTQVLRSVGGKPIHFIGQRADGGWEAITYASFYVSLMAGVQLANRKNALNELEYSEFIMRLRQIAAEFDAYPDVPDMTEVMTTARSLHHFIAEHDAKLGINVRSNREPWSVTTLLSALERQSFDVRSEGRLVMLDGEGGVLFSLSTNVTLAEETTSRLTLLLDVPTVSPQREGFGAMLACARSLASRLDGTVVDDDGQPLSEAALAEISGQIDAFYTEMESSEIPAGSTRALRLFN